ncbi:hypothetical protein BK816_03420 [Boudabousia tangfeifanii]|uniref:Stage II sporulation protein M n=1 Tax=Boudabousia tangfeifanii TaxID=1912795 RepID=A0A1D9MJU5_9ACTO|nr:stage II sporulation protein M [Boudabousia tangfeifanii]AOZ72459.1 hypothetical protein BK816_03420 [Boudabousia tangfeifanii]
MLEKLRKDQWRRLEVLCAKRKLSGPQCDELTHLYRQVAADLSLLQAEYGDNDTSAYLSNLLQMARSKMSGAPKLNFFELVSRFFLKDFPIAVWRERGWIIAATGLFLLVALVSGFHVYLNPDALLLTSSKDSLDRYANESFINYYSEHAASLFSTQVWTNNAWLAALMVALGLTGFVPVYILISNAAAVGRAGAVVSLYNSPEVFFSYILPHGILELSALFIAGGVGFSLFVKVLMPGRKTRLQALGDGGKQLLMVAFGLVFVLLNAGILEGYLTPSALPVWLKISIGTFCLLAWIVYFWFFGSRQAQLLAEDEHGYYQPTA